MFPRYVETVVQRLALAAAAIAAMAVGGAAADRQGAPRAVDVGPEVRAMVEADWLESDRLFAALQASTQEPGQPVKVNAAGVTTAQDASGAVDGIKNGRFGFHVGVGEQDPWWQVDLGEDVELDRVVVYNRVDGGTPPRTRNIAISVARDGQPEEFQRVYQHDGAVFYGAEKGKPLVVSFKDKSVTARLVRLHVAGECHLALDEVEVYPVVDPKKNIALGKPADQKSVSRHSVPGTAGEPAPPHVPAGGGFSLAHTRDVIQRGKRLAARFWPEADPDRLGPLVAKLDEIDSRLGELEEVGDAPKEVRQEIHFDARWMVRKIAFSNPLLDFDKLLFVKRHRGSLPHMCDQYYGFTAVPGGGLFVLSDPFGDRPKLTNLVEDSPVQSGRLEGRKLLFGSFLSPEVSYDGKTILFAYSENSQPMQSWDEVWPPSKSSRKWTNTNCYHIFRVGADGGGLVQLTDGPWDDFDPCFLPSGRIVFISERRGGYVRCGIRACRSFNLCSMEPDGTDVFPISYFDTNEWHPSVSHD
ncbi:MAG: discoidin domain-containing protein, partial [Planctomycetes bacterium]|nr:discoidin domain-containing protein [Planctomycetota bacterium]